MRQLPRPFSKVAPAFVSSSNGFDSSEWRQVTNVSAREWALRDLICRSTSDLFSRRSHVSWFQLLGFCCVAVLMVFLIRSGPETQAVEMYRPTESPQSQLSVTEGRPAAFLSPNETDALFAFQELHRLRCLRDLKMKLADNFAPYFEASNKKVVLMDIALHSNLGDNVLWKAALSMISQFGVSPRVVCYVSQRGYVANIDRIFHSCDIPEIIETVKDGGLVFLHAGGNWGDLYRFVQEARLDYLKQLTDAAEKKNFTVIQLPQSVSYKRRSKFLKMDDTLMGKINPSRFVFMARQQDGYDFAQEHYPHLNSTLTTDIAYILGPLMPQRRAEFDVLIQMRQDIEVKKSDEDHYDWIENQFREANMTFVYRDWWYHAEDNKQELSDSFPSIMGEVRVNAAVNLISKGRIVITNRLHGSILSTLLGKYIFMIDTVEGKLKKVHDVRRSVSENCKDEYLHVYPCSSLREAVTAAVELYKSVGKTEFNY